MAKGDIETYHEGGVWKNRVEGGQKASNTAETKGEAEAAGRQMASRRLPIAGGGFSDSAGTGTEDLKRLRTS